MPARMRLSSLLLIILLAALGLTGKTLGAPQPQVGQTLRIGSLLIPNSEAALGAQLAVDELNRAFLADPLRQQFPIEIIVPDTFPATPEDMPAALASLTGQQVRVILGPESNALALPALEPLARVGVPVLTLATSDTLTDVDVTNNIMRMRAAESYYSLAAADYMVNDLGLTKIALVQTDVESTEALIAYEIALSNFGYVPAVKVQLLDNTQLQANVPSIIESGAEAVAMWGPGADAALLQTELRSRGWAGVFFYRYAQEAALRGELVFGQTAGMLGANGWSYGTRTQLSRQFLVNYVSTYGKIPGDAAAAAYDAVYTFVGKAQEVGVGMPAIYEALLDTEMIFAVQGRFTPREYGNGDFSRLATVYQLGQYGGSEVLARYQNGVRLPDDDLIIEEINPVAIIGTPTFTPTPSLTPTQTFTPSATPSQVQLTVAAEEVGVYAGPGDFFGELGRLLQGTSATIVGGNTDLTWFVIQYRGGIGWVQNNLSALDIFDPSHLINQLPVIEAPPTPIGGATPTPALEVADIIIENVIITPTTIIPGQAFIANVTLKNNGAARTGSFSVAASFEPGAVFTSNVVPNIEPGASVTLPLSATVVGTGSFSVDVVADVTNNVNEGASGEQNNIFRLSYTVDYPIVAELSSLPVFAGTSFDLAGGTADLNWTGTSLDVINGARIGIVTGVTYENVKYDMLSSSVINSQVGLVDAQVFPGVLIGVITAEGLRAIIRVEARVGTSMTISFRVYSG